MGAQQDDTTAKNGLRLLNRYYRERPTRGAEGHSYISNAPRGTATAPGIPYNANVTDLIDASVREIADHTRDANPDAGPLPAIVEDIYDWCHQNTQHSDERQQQRRDAIFYRQQLEHAIAMGDTGVIPPHRCPACNTFSLMWRGQVVCTNGKCLTRDGMTRTWSLARIAQVTVEKTLRVKAT